jgi:hypothetical protein
MSPPSHALSVTAPNHQVRQEPGQAATPTFNGIKVVMQQGEDIPGTNTLRPNGVNPGS